MAWRHGGIERGIGLGDGDEQHKGCCAVEEAYSRLRGCAVRAADGERDDVVR
jgi:hypothetical protein